MRLLQNRARPAVAAVIAVTAATMCLRVMSAFGSQTTSRGNVISPEVRANVRQAMASTGLISVRNASDSPTQAPRPRGSGVVLRSDGVVVTNQHVITSAQTNRPYDEIFFSLPGDGDSASLSARYRLKPVLINKE